MCTVNDTIQVHKCPIPRLVTTQSCTCFVLLIKAGWWPENEATIENVEHCGGEPEQGDTGILLVM